MAIREVQASAFFGVPSFIVGNKLKNISSIKSYGKNKVVSCCIVENGIPPTEVGCVRRCTLSLKCFQGALLREKAVSIKVGENKTETILEYLPCGESEMNRSPFGPHATFRLNNAITSYAVHTVTTSANRCYVEFNTKLELSSNPCGDEQEEESFGEAIIYFWTAYLETLLRSLEAEVLAEAYPVLSGKIDTEFRNAYEQHEGLFCEWAASSSPNFPRETVLENFENILICWSRVLQEYRHQKLVAETIQADVNGAKMVSRESAKQLATSEASLNEIKKRVEELSTAPCFYRPPSATENTESRENKHNSHYVTGSRERQFFQHASTADCAPASSTVIGSAQIGLRKNCREAAEKACSSLVQISSSLIPISASYQPPREYSTSLLRNLFTEHGQLNEPQVQVLFSALDNKSKDFVTSQEIKTILLSMDHIGLYEDQDGTQDELERFRESIKEVYATRYSRLHASKSMDSNVSVSTNHALSDESASSALSRIVKRHDERKEVRRQNAMQRLADDAVARFCFRESGKLYFDEFCLVILHLLKF